MISAKTVPIEDVYETYQNTVHALIFSEDLMTHWFVQFCLHLLLRERSNNDWNESVSEPSE